MAFVAGGAGTITLCLAALPGRAVLAADEERLLGPAAAAVYIIFRQGFFA